jgi:ABC-type transport system involved in multi-copper enzyme maturation permease subunit
MITHIALKDFVNNLKTPRFITGFLLCIILIPFSITISINEYKSKQKVYEVEKKNADKENTVKVYSFYRPVIVKKPTALSIFARGISYNIGNRVKILLSDKPMLSEGKAASRDNPFLNKFITFDFVSVLIIILSLMALFFTYDICTGEKEAGMLKLVLSNPVSRSTVLLGKMLGTFISLLPILLFSYLLCILIIVRHPDVQFAADEWLRIGLIFLLSIVFMLLFMAIGLFVSSMARSSAISIVTCLVLWVSVLFIIPNMSNYAAKSFVKTGSINNLQYDLNALTGEFYKETEKIGRKVPRVDWYSTWMYTSDNDGQLMIGGASKSFMESQHVRNEMEAGLRLEYAEKRWALRKKYLDRIVFQQKVAQYLAFFSPSEIFKESAAGLCATNAQSHYNFMEHTRVYREELFEYYKSQHLFGSFKYFTQNDPSTLMTANEMINYLTKGECKTLKELESKHDFWYLFKFHTSLPDADFNQWKKLDLSEFPKFEYTKSKVLSDIGNSLVHIGTLILLAIIIFYISYVRFIKYDVR